jgi:hypothetical protein
MRKSAHDNSRYSQTGTDDGLAGFCVEFMKGTSMKPFVLGLALATLSTTAMAQSSRTTLTMTCAQARGLVTAQGAAVLHTGPTTYDRYVRDGSFCAAQEIVRPTWVRTADVTQCPIGGVCRSIEIDNGQ